MVGRAHRCEEREIGEGCPGGVRGEGRARRCEERARRAENYRAQVETTGEFEYDEFVLDAVSSGRPSAEIGELF